MIVVIWLQVCQQVQAISQVFVPHHEQHTTLRNQLMVGNIAVPANWLLNSGEVTAL